MRDTSNSRRHTHTHTHTFQGLFAVTASRLTFGLGEPSNGVTESLSLLPKPVSEARVLSLRAERTVTEAARHWCSAQGEEHLRRFWQQERLEWYPVF